MLKFCVKFLFCNHYFSPLNKFVRKSKDPEPHPELDFDPDPYIWLMDPDLGGPKTCGSGSGSTTLVFGNQLNRYSLVVSVYS